MKNLKHLILLFSVISLCSLSGCKTNPVTGKKELSLMSESKEIAMGKEYDPSIVASYGLYEDTKMQKFIDEKGQEMARISHRPHLNYEFKILDSPVVNAFAVPGGYVYFTRGIMAHFNNEAEFAGVLGHEIGHITARHSAKQYSKQMLGQVGLIAGVVLSPGVRNNFQQIQQGMGLLFLKFGRDAESQSDMLGVTYSTEVGYDSQYMAGFFKTLSRMREGTESENIPTFMSTHPDPGDRFNKVKQLTVAEQAKYPAKKYAVERDNYLRMIDGLVYGEDPKGGYVQNDVFYHPVMKFKFDVPRGWRTANSPAQFQMADPNGKAMMAFTLGQGKTLEEAAQNFISQNKLTLISSENGNVNGYKAIALVAEQNNEQDPTQSVRILNYVIDFGTNIFQLYGVSQKAAFTAYRKTFKASMQSFDKLTDPAKINVKPERIKIKTVSKAGNLRSVLNTFKVKADRQKEHAILNGMELGEQIKVGTLIKIIEK